MPGCLSFHCPSVPLASQDLVEFPQCKRVNLSLQTFPTPILGRSTEYWLTLEQKRPNHQSMEFSRLVGSLSLLQGIFPTQGLNPGFPHCRQILYQLSHKGSPRILKWVAYPFSSGSSWPRNRTAVSCIAGRFFTNWVIREALNPILPSAKSTNRWFWRGRGWI